MENKNGGAPGRSAAKEVGVLFVPGEVILPTMETRMIERNKFLRIRIWSLYLIVFVAVASGAGERQVL